jgi:hypothetical protein
MKNEDLNLDTAAEKMFGYPYASLSAWSQQHVREVVAKMKKLDAPYTASLPRADDVGTRLANERLAQENEQLRLENADLWLENTELQEELAKLKAEWNRPLS